MKKLVVLYILLCATPSNASWSQFQANPQHTGFLAVNGPQTSVMLWQKDIGSSINAFGGPSVGFYDGS